MSRCLTRPVAFHVLDLTLVGRRALDHILEYENYAGYDKTVAKIRNSDVSYIRLLFVDPIADDDDDGWDLQYIQAYNKMIPFLNARSSSLCQEFNFFPTAPPHTEGGVFELRRYQLKPGTLLEWEQTWCVCAD